MVRNFDACITVQMPLFQTETNGTARKQKFIMGQRNWCQVDWDEQSRELNFDIRVEKEKGHGQTVGQVFLFMASVLSN